MAPPPSKLNSGTVCFPPLSPQTLHRVVYKLLLAQLYHRSQNASCLTLMLEEPE